MLEWSWRIENETEIVCGSWSEEKDWEAVMASLVGRQIEDISTFGRLPELYIALSGGIYVASFMTAVGDPEWVLFDRTRPDSETRWITVEGGRIVEMSSTDR